MLNGPNLNLLGTREPDDGHATLADVEKLCAETSAKFGMKADCRQSNHEGELIDFIHEAQAKKAAGIVINAGGYSHTSIALHDVLVAVKIPAVEVHVSNIHARESFRHHSFTARAAFATLSGFGIDGYRLANRRSCRQGRRQGKSRTPARHHLQSSGSGSWRASLDDNSRNIPSDDGALIRDSHCCWTRPVRPRSIEGAGLRVRSRNITVAASVPPPSRPPTAPAARRQPSPPCRRPSGRSLADGRHRLLVVRTRRQAVHRSRHQGIGRTRRF